MNAWIRNSQTGKSLFATAMLLALFLRILIPTGFMPTVGAQGIFVELCSGTSGETVAIEVGKKAPADKQHIADSPCIFAAGLGQGLLTTAGLPVILPFVHDVTLVVGTAIADLTINRLAAPPPPSQGPPALR